jgi:hypothetical protein
MGEEEHDDDAGGGGGECAQMQESPQQGRLRKEGNLRAHQPMLTLSPRKDEGMAPQSRKDGKQRRLVEIGGLEPKPFSSQSKMGIFSFAFSPLPIT